MKVLGGILIGAGILMAALSGLCSLSLIIEEVMSSSAQKGEWIVLIAVVGGIPFLMGLGMIFGGWKLLNEKPRV